VIGVQPDLAKKDPVRPRDGPLAELDRDATVEPV